MYIRDMRPGDSGYILPWAIAVVNGQPLMNRNYSLEPTPRFNHTVLLRRTQNGWIAKDWEPVTKKPVNAVVSISTQKYPWNGAVDEDIVPVNIAWNQMALDLDPPTHR